MTGHSGIVPTDSGIVTSDSGQALKLGTIDRNGWARWTGMAGHDGPESVGTMDRNTQFGFFGKFQGIQGKGLTPPAVALEIVCTLLRKPQHRDELLRAMSSAFATLQSDIKVKQFGLLDSWAIVSDQQLRIMLEQSALSDFEKRELKSLIARVEAFKATGPGPAEKITADIPF